jgi:hypothetical protein
VIAYPLITFPTYYRVMKKTGLSWMEYGSAVAPALSGSGMMVGVVLAARFLLRLQPHSVVTLSLLVATGAASYAGGLMAFYRERVMNIIKTTRSMLLGREVRDRGSGVGTQVDDTQLKSNRR